MSVGARRQPHDKITFSIIRGPVISDKCAQLYASGLSLAEVACELGIAKATVLRNLRSHSSSLEQDTQALESKLKRKRDHKSGNSPFGYLYVRGQLVVHPKEIEVVHKIIALWNSGSNLRSIADTLNGQGLTTRKGTIWRHPTITSILQRELKEKFNPQRRGE